MKSKELNKRSVSPLVTKTIEASERKKKSTSNYPSNPYKVKEFESYGRTQKKKHGNYLKDVLKQHDSGNKYRIVTEPVDDRIMHLVSSSFGRISKSKHKLDTLDPTESQINNFKVRNSSHSNEKLRPHPPCKNCEKYQEELSNFKAQLNKIFMSKILWKNGQMTLEDLQDELKIETSVGSGKIMQQYKSMDSLLNQTKKHFYDMMKDIESLSQIDYPKMLKLNIFKYEPNLKSQADHQESEIQELLGQLRKSVEGKIQPWDLEDDGDENEHVKVMMRNLKARLSHSLRENLQFRMKKAFIEKADEISSSSEDYLQKIVEDVLTSYAV